MKTAQDGVILDIENEEDFERFSLICTALSDKKRLRILQILQRPPHKYSIRELATIFQMPISTLVHHLQILEQAKLIHARYRNDSKKESKVIHRASWNIYLSIYKPVQNPHPYQLVDTQMMPIGHYVDFNGADFHFVTPTNTHSGIYSPERFESKLIFTTRGVIEYYFDNTIAKNKTVNELSFSLELCSEFPFYDNSHKSDITFWINDVKLTTYRCEGDYGDRRGNLNPYWWPSVNSQYGKLVSVSVNRDGVHLNGVLVNEDVTLQDLSLAEDKKISLKFGNDDAEEYPGGFNLFGSEFGDYPQDIIFQLYYNEESVSM